MTFVKQITPLKKAALGGVAALMMSPAAQAGSFGDVEQALLDSQLLMNLRLRYEHVDQDPIAKNANAVTFRARLGILTGEVLDTKALFEFEHIDDWGDNYNSTINGMVMYPVVADPIDTQVNRAVLINSSFPDTTIKLGRQRIILDNARFVGNVGWRQNEQTFDALRVTNKSIKNVTLDGTYIDEVHRIFGGDSPVGRFDSDSYLFNAKVDVPLDEAKLSVTGFAYLLEFDNAAAMSSETYGVLATAKKGPVTLKASYAAQSDYENQPVNYDEDYYWIEGAYKHGKMTFAAGYEVLTGDGTKGFATPLATGHAFNGWADLFLGTPANGLEDLYGKFVYARKDVGPFDSAKLVVLYHDFKAENGGMDYGDEIDAVLALNKGALAFKAKYASYDADGFGTDRDKFWLEVAFDLGKVKKR